MNEIISTFFFAFFIVLFLVGIFYTFRTKLNIKKILSNEKILFKSDGFEILNKEALGISYMNGNITIYENYIQIESLTFSHFIISPKKFDSLKKIAGIITLNECSFGENNKIKLKGKKHRLLSQSYISINMKGENISSLKRIEELINLNFLE